MDIQSETRKNRLCVLGFTVFFIVASLIFYSRILTSPPMGIHSWAQSDRFALAYGFFDHGMNFFLPRTLNLASEGGITGVEFPLQAWLSAGVAHLTGRQSITIVFRILDIVIAYFGLLSLFLIVFSRTRHFLISLAAPIALLASPIFTVYSGTSMPDPASVSVILAAMYFLLKWLELKGSRYLAITIALLALAVLIKTSAAIYFVSSNLLILIVLIRSKQPIFKKPFLTFWLANFLSLAVIIFYYLYNQYLNETYHSSLFLSSLLPFTDAKNFTDYINYSLKFIWLDNYFVYPAYLFITVMLVAGWSFRKAFNQGKIWRLWAWITLPLSLLMFFLMGHQLGAHDYYIIVILLPVIIIPLAMSLVMLYNGVGHNPEAKKLMGWPLGSALLVLFLFADFQVGKRNKDWYPPFSDNYGYRWMQHGDEVLAGLQIPRSALIGVLADPGPNEGLLYFQRYGINYYDLNDGAEGEMQQMDATMAAHHIEWMVIKTQKYKAMEGNHPEQWVSYPVVYQDEGKTVLKYKSE